MAKDKEQPVIAWEVKMEKVGDQRAMIWEGTDVVYVEVISVTCAFSDKNLVPIISD